jgi:hypothetical protein
MIMLVVTFITRGTLERLYRVVETARKWKSKCAAFTFKSDVLHLDFWNDSIIRDNKTLVTCDINIEWCGADRGAAAVVGSST